VISSASKSGLIVPLSFSLLQTLLCLAAYSTAPGLHYIMAYPCSIVMLIVALLLFSKSRTHKRATTIAVIVLASAVLVSLTMLLTGKSTPSQEIGLIATGVALAGHALGYHLIWKIN